MIQDKNILIETIKKINFFSGVVFLFALFYIFLDLLFYKEDYGAGVLDVLRVIEMMFLSGIIHVISYLKLNSLKKVKKRKEDGHILKIFGIVIMVTLAILVFLVVYTFL